MTAPDRSLDRIRITSVEQIDEGDRIAVGDSNQPLSALERGRRRGAGGLAFVGPGGAQQQGLVERPPDQLKALGRPFAVKPAGTLTPGRPA